MKRNLQALAVILLLGAVKLPLEQRATHSLRELKLLSPPPDISLRDSLGQAGMAATLGGLRSLVASIMYLQAFNAWTRVDWASVDTYSTLSTLLLPRFTSYWKEHADHMSYDAASYYLNNKEVNAAVRGKLFNDYVARGIAVLQEGLKVMPDNGLLWLDLAEIYQRRAYEPVKAAEAYLQVFRLTQNQRWARFAGYQYAETADPELWQKAYDLLKKSYDLGQKLPSVIVTLKKLETKLKLPEAQRIPEKVLPMPDNMSPLPE